MSVNLYAGTLFLNICIMLDFSTSGNGKSLERCKLLAGKKFKESESVKLSVLLRSKNLVLN